MDKVFVVKRLAEKLWSTEDAIDGAIAQASGLLAAGVEARQELKVSALFGDEATSKVAEAVKALADARHAMVEAHNALSEDKLRLGVRTKMDGGKPVVIETERAEPAERRSAS